MISVEGLTVEFGGFTLFDDVSFVVNKKDRIALVGKNGAGKSTALKMITDMERIGDQASDIAEIIITEDKSEAQDIPMIIKMSEAASKMVRDKRPPDVGT